MLHIQIRISWAFDIWIRRFKNQKSSKHIGQKFSWRIKSKINSFWRTKLQQNLVVNLLVARFSSLMLEHQKGISWASFIEIKQFKKPKFIYTYRTTTFMKDPKWEKFNKIRDLSREQTLVVSTHPPTEISIYILNIYLFLALDS
jgi:hypothetical protein